MAGTRKDWVGCLSRVVLQYPHVPAVAGRNEEEGKGLADWREGGSELTARNRGCADIESALLYSTLLEERESGRHALVKMETPSVWQFDAFLSGGALSSKVRALVKAVPK